MKLRAFLFVVPAIGLLALVCLLSACSSLQRAAKKHLERGEYEAALTLYTEILKETNPNNASALEGLRQTREGIISRRLIAIRFARLAQNLGQAIESLRRLLEDEKKWEVYPAGAVFSTQREEIEEAFHHFSNVIDAHLDAGRPVLARLFFEKFKEVFWQGKSLPATQSLWKRIDQSGRKSCMVFTQGVTPASFYFRNFVERYCRYWSIENAIGGETRDKKDLPGFYKSVALDCKISNFPAEIGIGFLKEKFQSALEKSPYYDPLAKEALAVGLYGQFRSSLNETPVSLDHGYSVREPYTEYVKVKKKRQLPYQELVQISSTPVIMAPVTKYRAEEYYEQEPVTKFREVPKIHRFEGIGYKQDLILLINGKVQIGNHEMPINLYEADHREGVAHDTDLPAIGLFKKRKEVFETISWLKDKSHLLEFSLAERLDNQWFDLYCRPPEHGRPSAFSEAVHKCRQGRRGMDAELVTLWFKSNIGVSPLEMLNAFSR